MTERPIIFSAPMVRAILAGTKTQTRRVWKMPTRCDWYAELGGEPSGYFVDHGEPWWLHVSECRCPYGQAGDRLWVRESLTYCSEYGHRYAADGTFLCSVFDDEEKQTGYSYECDMREGSVPSIHLPRRWSRITLEVTSVRVERLGDISEADAIAEGIGGKQVSENDSRWLNYMAPDDRSAAFGDPRFSFWSLWESINGRASRDANPWVWAVEFRRAA